MRVDVYWHDRTGARKIKANFRKGSGGKGSGVCCIGVGTSVRVSREVDVQLNGVMRTNTNTIMVTPLS